MEAATVQQPEKFLVRNNTAGYIGVIEIDHRGEEKGINIKPHGARWMTEREMVATSQAPQDPSDNPFEEQVFCRQNPDTQRQEEFKLRPLTLEQDSSRYVPSNDRYVPTQDAPEGAVPGVQQEAPAATPPVPAPASTGSAAGSAPPPPPPAPVASQGAPAPALRTERADPTPEPETALTGSSAPAGGDRDEGESWLQPPERPGEVIGGSLAGEDGAPPEEGAAAAPDPSDHPGGERFTPVAGQAQAAPQTPGAVDEEHAKVDPEVGEETGQARPPSQSPPKGEFARAEEVGSPDAPEQGDGDDATPIGG